MPPDILEELHGELSRGSPARLAFTRKAFHMLPDLEDPRILDVGCGQGGPTLELARLSGGQVTGLDFDPSALEELARRADEEGLLDHVQVVRRSMADMDFPDGSFDVIWSEGSGRLTASSGLQTFTESMPNGTVRCSASCKNESQCKDWPCRQTDEGGGRSQRCGHP